MKQIIAELPLLRCKWCGSLFKPSRKNKTYKYCQTSCRIAARKLATLVEKQKERRKENESHHKRASA